MKHSEQVPWIYNPSPIHIYIYILYQLYIYIWFIKHYVKFSHYSIETQYLSHYSKSWKLPRVKNRRISMYFNHLFIYLHFVGNFILVTSSDKLFHHKLATRSNYSWHNDQLIIVSEIIALTRFRIVFKTMLFVCELKYFIFSTHDTSCIAYVCICIYIYRCIYIYKCANVYVYICIYIYI